MTTDIARSPLRRYAVYVYDTTCPGCGQPARSTELCRYCWVPVPDPRYQEPEDAPEGHADEAGSDDPAEADTVLEREGTD